ncbi:hypothetical protein PVK06_016771 [Gossypium arboreum]|uniref:Uncharacterized protein n=1 Tax=Gossypium arboreum TaxID=29729 RepID=A0ABR0Q1A4_GOSAR|nr:hypothetical protein PVK06_016771 [Gossypium arboreum]
MRVNIEGLELEINQVLKRRAETRLIQLRSTVSPKVLLEVSESPPQKKLRLRRSERGFEGTKNGGTRRAGVRVR